MRGLRGLALGILLVVVAGVVVYAPAYLARAATAPDEPVEFVSHPVQGWRFLLTAVREVPSARAPTPARARQLAVEAFRGSVVEPLRVDLLYLPKRRIRVRARTGSTVLTAKGTLVWKVTGRPAPDDPIRIVGLIDFASGALTYDVRTPR
jgi:hypothetical protein